ncbi:MAG: MraY family glycosyltransferase [Methylomonas sp.]
MTGLIRYYALSNQVLDIPNQRSSHTVPTARGGGLAIVLAFFASCVYLFLTHRLDMHGFGALCAPLLVAFIGFCDDHAHVSARWRFLMHLLAALAALFFLNGLPLVLVPKPFDAMIGRSLVNLDWLGYLLGTVLLVWLLNLFNFMDGTDGIAASESLFVSSALAGYLYFIDPVLFSVAISLAAASLGFLSWNWPRAKIFMGDVGSGYLGLLLGIVILMAAQQAAVLLYCGLILFGIFVVDATYTLLVRFFSGQKWYDAHCTHTYQRAAKQYGHLHILFASWAINLFWLLPVSLWVFLHPAYALMGLLVAYLPLIFLALHFKAGQAEIAAS